MRSGGIQSLQIQQLQSVVESAQFILFNHLFTYANIHSTVLRVRPLARSEVVPAQLVIKAMLGSMTAGLASRWRQWLPGWAQSPQENGSGGPELNDLPPPLRAQLQDAVGRLPTPRSCRTTIIEAVAEGLRHWRQQPQAGNALVILANPLEPLERYLSDAINDAISNAPLSAGEELKGCRLITPLPAGPRPDDPLALAARMGEALNALPSPPIRGTEACEGTTLVLIPALEMLILRCIGGWESVELLRAELVGRPDLFWVIGCNRWAWRFLDAVAGAEACFGPPIDLPGLAGEDLEPWLNPLRSGVEGLPVDPDQGADTCDWQELADLARGVGSIAARLWLDGLRLGEEGGLTATVPVLRSLPSLIGLDRYLLHAVLIHGRISRAHLSRSLGETDGRAEVRSQWLLRHGVLEAQGDILSVSPLFYRRVASELANNNFFVESD